MKRLRGAPKPPEMIAARRAAQFQKAYRLGSWEESPNFCSRFKYSLKIQIYAQDSIIFEIYLKINVLNLLVEIESLLRCRYLNSLRKN